MGVEGEGVCERRMKSRLRRCVIASKSESCVCVCACVHEHVRDNEIG